MKISKKIVGVLVGVIASLVFMPNVFANGETIKEFNFTISSPSYGDTISAVDETVPTECDNGEMNCEKTVMRVEYPPMIHLNSIKTLDDTVIQQNNFSQPIYTEWAKKLPSEVSISEPSADGLSVDEYIQAMNDFMTAAYGEMTYGSAAELNGLTFEKGKEYVIRVVVDLSGTNYSIDPDPNAMKNLKIYINGKEPYVEFVKFNSQRFEFFTKISAIEPKYEPQENPQDPQSNEDEENKEETKKEETKKTIDVLDGAKQEYDATGKDRLKFRFDIDYEIFKKSGKVFVDGKEVDPKNYDSEEGSTIVVFTKAFTDELKAGNHTLKITTDEGEVETTFNVTKAVANPKTADNIVVYACLIIVALLGFAISRNEVFNKQN